MTGAATHLAGSKQPARETIRPQQSRTETDEKLRAAMGEGVRRKELSGLRWRDVDLVGSVVRVEESKTKEGERSVALSPRLTEALIEHLGRSTYTAPDDRVFGHRTRGTKLNRTGTGASFGRR